MLGQRRGCWRFWVGGEAVRGRVIGAAARCWAPAVAFAVALAVALAVPGPAAARKPHGARAPDPALSADEMLARLNRHESVHFTLYAEYDDDEYTRRLLGDLEKYYSLMQKEFWDFILPRHREGRVDVAVFAAKVSFDRFGRADAGIPHGEVGYLGARSNRMNMLRQDRYHKDLTIAVHELVHVFNSRSAPRTPIWLDEGMAQFYANFASEAAGGANVVGGVNLEAIRTIDAAVRSSRMPRLSRLLVMGEEEFYGPSSRINFAAAWALVHYMRRGQGIESDRIFSDYYRVISEGGDDQTAFTGSYGASFTILERVWLAYLNGLYARAEAELEKGRSDSSKERVEGDRMKLPEAGGD